MNIRSNDMIDAIYALPDCRAAGYHYQTEKTDAAPDEKVMP